MKINKVVGIGCSFTRNAIEGEERQRSNFNPELLEEYKHSFTSHLANRLNSEYENVSEGGIGNRHILRKLYRHINSNKHPEGTLYVIGLSFLSRFDFINPHTDGGKYTIPQYLDLEGDYLKDRARLFKMPLEDILNFSRIFFRYIYSDETTLQEINELMEVYRALVEKRGSQVIFLNATNIGVEFEGVFSFPNNARSWREFITSYDETYTGKHPNHDDHTRLGELLYTYISENFAEKIPPV